MGIILDFTGKDKCEKTIRQTWHSFTISLANKKYKYNEVSKALSDTFLYVFDELFQDTSMRVLLSTTLSDLSDKNTELCRGAKLKPLEKVNYDRFIPKSEFINEDNRFSPKGVEWLYLAIGNPISAIPNIENCCIQECRVEDNDRVGLCHFAISNKHLDKKIVDLTISDEVSFDKLNINFATNLKQSNLEYETKKWITFTYAKLMSENIFLPLETDDKELIYAPFQCLAQYFISKGYSGIIYKSTVCNGGKNIVLFDKLLASPTGKIKDFIFKG
ncbi:hypothetical protein C808_01808 [Lachnospiraceae bacterium M18-1]|jgi:hypothetical protein|nr:hypothetical protein C808_01808 [Lachnospiraceae bacterium M18-1]